jgi:hypothetical protein
MQGPIQVTKINNNIPTKHEYTLTLTFKANTWKEKEYDSVISKHDSGRLWIDSEPNVKLERDNYECNRKN